MSEIAKATLNVTPIDCAGVSPPCNPDCSMVRIVDAQSVTVEVRRTVTRAVYVAGIMVSSETIDCAPMVRTIAQVKITEA